MIAPEKLNELLTMLSVTPAKIQGLLDNLSDEQLRRRPAAGEFSLLEHVCHLRDIEVDGYALRINRILNEERPLLPDIDGGSLAVEREYNKQDIHEALQAFARARSESVNTLTNLGPEELGREGTLEGIGPVRLAALLVMMSEHDASHLREMAEVRC